jgi:hypothetical protein
MDLQDDVFEGMSNLGFENILSQKLRKKGLSGVTPSTPGN